MVQVCGTSKPTSKQYISCNKATYLNLSQTVLPTGESSSPMYEPMKSTLVQITIATEINHHTEPTTYCATIVCIHNHCWDFTEIS